MGNPLYEQYGAGQPQQPADFQTAMNDLRSHPAQMIRQAGFDVPDEIANNPQAAVMHILQSGQARGPIVQRLQPLIRMMTGWR